MNPLDLKSQEEWEEILERFAQQVGMTACLSNGDGGIIVCRYERFPLCGAIRENPDATVSICSQTNAAMRAVVEKTKRVEIDFCEAGLVRIVVPVIHNDKVIGQVMACGLASEEEEVDAFLVAQELKTDEEKILELAKSTPLGSKEEIVKAGEALFKEING